MKRISLFFLLLFSCSFAIAQQNPSSSGGNIAEKPADFKYRAAIQTAVNKTHPPKWYRIEIPLRIQFEKYPSQSFSWKSKSPTLNDLRVFDNEGKEVPFALFSETEPSLEWSKPISGTLDGSDSHNHPAYVWQFPKSFLPIKNLRLSYTRDVPIFSKVFLYGRNDSDATWEPICGGLIQSVLNKNGTARDVSSSNIPKALEALQKQMQSSLFQKTIEASSWKMISENDQAPIIYEASLKNEVSFDELRLIGGTWTPPSLSIEHQSKHIWLLIAAKGKAPFWLVYGKENAPAVAVPVKQIIPSFDGQSSLISPEIAKATLGSSWAPGIDTEHESYTDRRGTITEIKPAPDVDWGGGRAKAMQKDLWFFWMCCALMFFAIAFIVFLFIRLELQSRKATKKSCSSPSPAQPSNATQSPWHNTLETLNKARKQRE
jgi:hypothetical protein